MAQQAEQPADVSNARRDGIIEAVAQRIEQMGLTTAAILMFEAHKPLSFLGSQAILLLQPLLAFAFDAQTTSAISELLEDRGNVELLIRRLESGERNRAVPSG